MAVTFTIEEKIGKVVFDQDDSRVNILTPDALNRLNTIIDEVSRNAEIEVLLISSGKKDVFIAGADIKEIEAITDPADGAAKSKAGQDIFNKLEDLSIPTIAVIDGVALGGGCELAMACTYRVATFNDKVKIGLPEVNLGILPGFGGTYRLPRLVGLSRALQLILAGKIISSKEALKIGLVDRLFSQTGLDNSVREFIAEIQDAPRADKTHMRTKQKGLMRFLDKFFLGHAIVFSQSLKNVMKLTKGFYPAPLKALAVVKATINLSRQKALDIEARVFGELAITDVSNNLVNVFYLSEKHKKLMPPDCESVVPKTINKCGVLGAGIMGGGIAQLLSYKDIRVRLKDINYEAVAKGFQSAYKVFRGAVKKRKLRKAQAEIKMAKITGTIDFSGFKNVDCVIEAVVENMEIKKQVFQEISRIVPEDAILCSNTSALSVTEMSSQTKDPSKVVGFHFFNPVHRMPLLEIIKTEMTSNETIVSVLALAKRLGKTPIIVKDTPGFLINRILLAYINEAGYILEEGADVEFIDRIMTDFGMPMGPLTLADEVGLDVGVKVLHILEEGLGERFKPVGIFDKVCARGLLGKKSGKGFYIHKKKRVLNPEILQIQDKKISSQESSAAEGAEDADSATARFSAEDCRDRMVMIMINEAARCLQDGIIDDFSTIDIGMIMGTGFPPFRGGLLKYADSLGVEKVVDFLQFFADKFNADRFKPCDYLVEMVKSKKKFYNSSTS